MQDTINGRRYSLWPQFVDKKEEYIGGILEDLDSSFDGPPPPTMITDIEFRANGKESAWFEVKGKDYSCGGDVGHLGVVGGDEGWLTLSGYGGALWRFKPKEKNG